jgi:hypothetical protein
LLLFQILKNGLLFWRQFDLKKFNDFFGFCLKNEGFKFYSLVTHLYNLK